MEEIQTEVQDNLDRETEHFISSVTTTPVEIETTSGKEIQLAKIHVPSKGPNSNNPGAILLVSWDGTIFETFPRGATEMWPGKGYNKGTGIGNAIKIKADSGTVKYEIKLLS